MLYLSPHLNMIIQALRKYIQANCSFRRSRTHFAEMRQIYICIFTQWMLFRILCPSVYNTPTDTSLDVDLCTQVLRIADTPCTLCTVARSQEKGKCASSTIVSLVRHLLHSALWYKDAAACAIAAWKRAISVVDPKGTWWVYTGIYKSNVDKY